MIDLNHSRNLAVRPRTGCFHVLFVLAVLIVGLHLMLAGRVTAQSFTTLHSFTGGSDGAVPQAGLILSGNTLYGTAVAGGTSGEGTVFSVNTDGTGFTSLYSSFTGSTYSNSDGAYPYGELILSGNTLYGTASQGGSSGDGTVFKLSTDGTGFTTLHSFAINSDGGFSLAGLVLSGNTLFGTADGGGSGGAGTVFAVSTDGTGFTTLHSFTAGSTDSFYTNSDGINPSAGLILSGTTLYGTANQGGSSGLGTVFRVNTDGTGFTNLYTFSRFSGYFTNWMGGQLAATNTDGAYPWAGLILSGNTLYGTANEGGSSGYGTVFKINTDGTAFETLHSFTGPANGPANANADGAYPATGLILSGNTLYGTAYKGGSSGNGTVFKVNTDGSGLATLHSFTAGDYNSDGANPYGVLVLSGNNLYGTASYGGSSGHGTVFSISLPTSPPQLTLIPSAGNVVLTWPTNYTGYHLESTINLGSSVVWSTNSPAPVVVNGQNTVTNPISGSQQFFRLSQ